jgi:transcription elongation GreA/GreB family factor
MKQEIIEQCKKNLKSTKISISKEIEAVKESMTSDTKSSAGDKYETGREMMNQEKEKLQSQLSNINRQLGTLHQINASEQNQEVQFGSIVKTTLAQYFISISYGKISVDNTDVFMVSAITPLAQIMMGKKAGEKIKWNGKEVLIESVY